MTSGVARNGRIEIAYETHGPPDGRPLLLISGSPGQLVLWPERFLDALVERGFRVAVFDHRDAGRSTHLPSGPESRYTLGDMAGDAVAVLDAVNWTRAHVAGISLGGMIGQVMAVHHAERVRSLTSMSSAPGWSLRISRSRPRTLVRLATMRKPVTSRETAADLAVRMRRVIGSPDYPLDEPQVRETAMRAYDISPDPDAAIRQFAAAKASGDRRAELAGVTVPTLVVHGDRDPMQSMHAARATVAAIPGSRLLVLPGVGHDLAPPPLWPVLLDAITTLADEADGADEAEDEADEADEGNDADDAATASR